MIDKSNGRVVVSTLYLDPTLHSAAKACAAQHGWTLKVLMQRALRNEIARLATTAAS